jgi:low affinity Fe/Cu permease
MRGSLPAASLGGTVTSEKADWFRQLAMKTSYVCGRPVTFASAVGICILWAATGPLFHYSDTWQLVINTGTTIVTFLMVFLIQATQNRDTTAIQLKLDELVLAIGKANNKMVAVEEKTDDDLETLKEETRLRGQTETNA